MLLDKIYGVLVLHSQASSDIRDKQITTLESLDQAKNHQQHQFEPGHQFDHQLQES